jgi:hypothetical protein
MRYDKNHHGAWRRTAALAITVGIALLAAACSGSTPHGSTGSSQTGGSTTYQKELAFSQCVRSHGVPNFPDPTSNGNFINNGQVDMASAPVQSAEKACRHLLPNGGQPTQAQRQQALKRMLNFARCMRTHGYPNFPDPTQNGLTLQGSGISRATVNTPQFQAAQRTCQSSSGTVP